MMASWLLLGMVCSIKAPHPCKPITMATYPNAEWCESGREAMTHYPYPGLIKVWCAKKEPVT